MRDIPSSGPSRRTVLVSDAREKNPSDKVNPSIVQVDRQAGQATVFLQETDGAQKSARVAAEVRIKRVCGRSRNGHELPPSHFDTPTCG